MKAIQYVGVGQVRWAEVPEPRLAPGRALVRVAAAGICHTDVQFRASRELAIPPGTVLGHEIAGTVADIADDVASFGVGDRVLVYPVWSCGMCRQCAAGRENSCLGTGDRLTPPPVPGVSVHGGLAELVSVPASALISAAGLEPALAATLTDAGLVPYHSIKSAPDLLNPGASAVIIGLGGLGQFAATILRAVTNATIVGLDVRTDALAMARDKADHLFVSTDDDVVDRVLSATGGYGADLVLDFVGATATLRLASTVVRPYGAIRVPGQSGGVLQFAASRTATLARGATIARPYSGTFQDLVELVSLARSGQIGTSIRRYRFERALQAFDDLDGGRFTGRAVLVMG